MNIWEAMQQKLANIYQFLYHVTPVVTYQVKSWSDSTFCWSFKFSSFLIQVLFFIIFWILPMISTLFHFFNEENGPKTENAYYLESGLLRAKKSFFQLFHIADTKSMPKSRFHQTFISNTFSHYPGTSCPNLVRIKIGS